MVYSHNIVLFRVFLYLHNMIKRSYRMAFNGKTSILVKIEIMENVNAFKRYLLDVIQTISIIVITVFHNFNKLTVNGLKINLEMFYTRNIYRNGK